MITAGVQARTGQDDEQGDPAQVGGKEENALIQETQDMRTEQNAGEQHAQQGWQPEPGGQPPQRHAAQKDQCQTL